MATANLLAENGQKVTLLVLDGTSDSFYPVSEQITVITEELDFGIGNEGNAITRKLRLWRQVKSLRKILLRLVPQMVICTEYPFSIAAYGAVRNRIPVVAWEHHHFFHLPKSRFWQLAFRSVYPRLRCVVCLNAKEADLFAAIGCRVMVIPNFVSCRDRLPGQSKTLLTIGWLTLIKGVDQIPAIAEAIFTRYPDWKWTVIGSGEKESWLAQKATEAVLQGRLQVLPPRSSSLENLYKDAGLYVMLSRMECFPMVLLEAQAFGLPAVAFECPTGPGAIIRHDKNGLLIPPGDVPGMTKAIFSLIDDEEKRHRLGMQAHQDVKRFSPAAIWPMWQKLLQDL